MSSCLGLLPRRAHVFFTAAIVYVAIKGTQLFLRFCRLLHSSLPFDKRAWSRTHHWCARRLLRLAMQRRALWLKLCQYLSSRADILPPEYCSVLEACLDSVPPEHPARLLELVKRELGGADPAELFDGFDPANPIASASIAQVHRATLKADGSDIVLKVQRPGVKQVLLQDLEDLTTIMLMVAGAEPEFDFRPMLQAWVDMVPLETDFLHEMRSGQFVSSTLEAARGTKFESAAFVPRAIPEHTTERLLVMEYVRGCSVRDLEAMDMAGVDREKLVTEISKAFALQAHVLGRINADCHPGNILVRFNDDGSPGGVPALIDFGITVELTDKQRLGFCRTVLAAVDNNSFSLLQSFADMDVVLNRADPNGAMDAIKHLFRSTASREDTVKQSREFFQRQKERNMQKSSSGIAVNGQVSRRDQAPNDSQQTTQPRAKRKLFRRNVAGSAADDDDNKWSRNPVDAFPGYLVFMFRTLALLRGLSSRLGVEHAYLPILAEYAKQAIHDACPEPDRLTSLICPVQSGEATPRSLSSRKAIRLRKILSRVIGELDRRNLIVGCQVSAYLNGEIILDLAAGRMGKYNPRPVTPSSLFNVFSVSKGVVAVLYAKAADEYCLLYDDLVGKHWPAYACNGKELTTIGHILSHCAGLAQVAPSDMSMLRLRDDWSGVIDWLAKEAKPAHKPGSRLMYHYLSFGWLVAGLLEAVSGKNIQEHLRLLSEELGIQEECYIGLPEKLCADSATSRVAMLSSAIFSDLEKMINRRRLKEQASLPIDPNATSGDTDQARNMERLYDAEQRPTDAVKFLYEQFLGKQGRVEEVVGSSDLSDCENQDESKAGMDVADVFSRTPYLLEPEFFSHPVMRAAVIPSANGHFSARALAKIYGMLANDGKIDGKTVLEPGRAAKMMQTLHEAGVGSGSAEQRHGWQGEAYGAGVRLYDIVDKNGKIRKKKAMGHGGVGGSISLCVPDFKFSFAFNCNQLNAVSAAEAVILCVVFRVLDIPMPCAYAQMIAKVRSENFDSVEDAFAGVELQVDSWLDELNLMQAMTG
jgi:predicted unusual protein kinase regulating ubiquinone biosynthesis (AarF/ABC1/UbiB family)/CubicO group peptidase (beta-lactamase class C family)